MTLLEHIDLAIKTAAEELDGNAEALLIQIRQRVAVLPARYLTLHPPAPAPVEATVVPPDPARQLRDNEQLFQPAQPSLPGT